MRALLGSLILAIMPFSVLSHDLSEAEMKAIALQAIRENPEIVMEAVAILEQRERAQQAQGASLVVAELQKSTTSPVIGNPDGDVTIVEFFDYNCGFCRRSGPILQDILGEDSGVKVIMREWPILGEGSVYAARAALAARNQGKYEEFHWGLMNGGGRATPATVRQLAKELDMDVEKLLADMNSPAVDAHIDESNQMARSLGFTGTPAFIIGDQVNPGYMEKAQMDQMIAAAREG